ncbi:zinc finger protein 436-like [Clinocottus analis]|uniref:zinc finger protein 436-like n=1 Tax=Clinocottus analis TaxID=304258 RepID=UPI0035BEC7F0
MSKAEMLRLLVKQRVHAASEETLQLFDRLTAVYEEEVSRFRENELRTKLLEAVSIPRVQIHRSEMLRLLVKQRLHAASEETLGLIDRFTADYEEEVSRLRENERRQKLLEAVFNPRVQIHRSDVQQLLEIKAEVPPECLDLDQEDPKPPHIKEEEEDLWTRLEGEQLQEADLTKFLGTAVTVKSEDDKPQTLLQSQTEDNREAEPPVGRSETQIKTETDGEDCRGSGPARNLNPHRHSHPNADDEKASESFETEVISGDCQEPLSDSGPESEDKDNVWKETRAPESAAYVLKYNEGLVSHVGCNTGNKSFSFFNCSTRFYYKGFLQRHMMCNFGKMSSSCLVRNKCFRVKQKKESQPRVLTGENPFSCDVCGNRFKRLAHLKRHMRVHTGEKLFSCDVCGKRCTRQENLKRHMRIHTGEKPFGCDVCEKRFADHGTLKKHIRIHTGEKPFGCDVCRKRFADQGTLNTHMRVHTGHKSFGCNVCGKILTLQGNLNRHMRVHTGEKPFGCNVCGKRFAEQGHVKKHMRVHTGEKLFSCDVCGKRCTRQENLKRHMRIHTGEKPFGCDVCGKQFADHGTLKKHIRVHTGDN